MSQTLFDLHYKQFEAYFSANADLPWSQWLALPKSSDNNKDAKKKNEESPTDGKQGYVGILQHPHNRNLQCLYKISKVDDNLVEHEFRILDSLGSLAEYCPHFHRAFGVVPFQCNVHYENDSPLEFNSRSKQVTREMLIMQYVPHKYDFHEMIRDESIKDEVIITVMKEIFLCLHLAQAFRFTHYDLHTENILIRNCNPNLHLLYLLDEETAMLVPSYGYIPNIIDFGFSYCDTKPNPLTCTLVHTQEGYTSTRFDPHADLKLFFISTVHDIAREEHRKGISNKLLNISRNIFSGMNVSWASGWDRSKQVSPVKIVHELIRDYVRESVLFSKSDLWFDSIQQLIELPLTALPYHELETACRGFIQEFVKFEERIISKTLLNYILRVLVKYIRTFRESYLKGGEEGMWALIEIKKLFLEEYTQLINYHVPSIDYEKMICSLLLMAQCMEGLFHDYLEKRYTEKDKQYEIMRCKTPQEFYRVLDHNFPATSSKPFSLKSQIFIIDHVHQKSTTLSLNKHDLQVLERVKTSAQAAQYLRNRYLASTEFFQ